MSDDPDLTMAEHNDSEQPLGSDGEHQRAVLGDVEAQFRLGERCRTGRGGTQDNAQAFQWYRMAAAAGHPGAQNSLGICLTKGIGCEKDILAGVEFFRQAAAQGLPLAMNNLGSAYRKGQGVAQSHEQAVAWFSRAAYMGLASAQNSLASCFQHGEGTPVNPATAATWYRKAAEQGYALAQRNLGSCYRDGFGVDRDLVESAKWYAKAAHQGNEYAQYHLGMLYLSGSGVERNAVLAAEFFRKAAHQGLARAQFQLGICYLRGDGVRMDLEEASRWMRRAADAGSTDAQEHLGKTEGKPSTGKTTRRQIKPVSKPLALESEPTPMVGSARLSAAATSVQPWPTEPPPSIAGPALMAAQDPGGETTNPPRDAVSPSSTPQSTVADVVVPVQARAANLPIQHDYAASDTVGERTPAASQTVHDSDGNFSFIPPPAAKMPPATIATPGISPSITSVAPVQPPLPKAQIEALSVSLAPSDRIPIPATSPERHVVAALEATVSPVKPPSTVPGVFIPPTPQIPQRETIAVSLVPSDRVPVSQPSSRRITATLPSTPAYARDHHADQTVEPFTDSLTKPPSMVGHTIAPATAAFRASNRPTEPNHISPAAVQLYQQGIAWLKGDGVAINKAQGVVCLTNAAKLEYAPAMYLLGQCYEKGDGVAQDKQLALSWYRRAADLGNAPAQYQLAAHLTYGWGMKRDLASAVQWYLLSATQGHAPAQYQLGDCFAKGWGVKPDLVQAVSWWGKAAQQGHQDAQDSLKKFRR